MNLLVTNAVLALLSNRPKPISIVLKRHFHRDPRKFPIVQAEFSKYRRACVCKAIEQYLAGPSRHGIILGVAATTSDANLSDMIHPDSYVQQTVGPVRYNDVELSDGGYLSCAERAIYLIRDKRDRFAVHLYWNQYDHNMLVEVMAKDRVVAEKFLAELRMLADAHSIFKGHVMCLKEEGRELSVRFQRVPAINRSQLILPANVIDEIERHTLVFSSHREILLARGRHLKRGLLLYGPPGTGKSLTVMYLLGKMTGRTTVLLSGQGVRHLEDACSVARQLQPSTVVIDDVDLVAEERTQRHENSMLFELLNQMDGIADDADVLFLLCTNRPEILEPALISRPGRIDQAIMIPLPDEDCRRRLFELYGQGLPLAVADMQRFIDETNGVSAAFIRELFRKASLFALEEGTETSVQDRHLARALELLRFGSSLTARLLGGASTGENSVS